MIAEERLPSLGWGPSVPCHVFGDRGLANFDAKLEELTVDPGRAPEGIGKVISRINWRISSGTFGLPLRDRDFHFQNKRKPARCQPITVSGFTITKGFRTFGAIL